MSSARRPLPTDIVALVSFDGRVYPNEAKPLDRLGVEDRPHPLETALEQWFSFATGKHTWVSVRGATIQGLISARRRGNRTAWEVEVLIDASDDQNIVLSLFSRMAAGVTKAGAERVFLRLDADSALVDTARAAGFFQYTLETLYRREKGPRRQASAVGLRPRGQHDQHGIYQLYAHAVPANVRAIEGPTMRQWQAALEPWGGRTTDLVLEEDSIIKAWLRVLPGQPGRFRIVAEQAFSEMDGLVHTALSRLRESQTVLTLVPAYDGALADSLTRAGFAPAAEYMTLAKRLAKPVEEEEAVQEAARKAVPVS